MYSIFIYDSCMFAYSGLCKSCTDARTRHVRCKPVHAAWCVLVASATCVHDSGAATCVHDSGASTCVHDSGASTCVHDSGASTCVHNSGAATILHNSEIGRASCREGV